jgi:2-dehydro-3-deoxyphosphogalactonate aldolase
MTAPDFANANTIRRFDAACQALPLVAILRGLSPPDAQGVGQVLYRAGFRLIEVPLNSPQPFDSIARLRQALPPDALVGAGTVRRLADVDQLAALGADLVVMPHADTEVIGRAVAAGMVCMPGVATVTEAFAALDAGATALKLFPAELVTPAVLKAMRAVLPPALALFPVGGITPPGMAAYVAAGARGFGLGSALFTPGKSLEELAQRADAFVAAWRQ